jgi:NitT/TauT family transport system ATP-binding protein
MKNIVEIDNLSKTYHSINGEVLAINNISLNVSEGEFVSILGSSGCGKSTILNILSGLDKNYSGSVRFNKNDMIIGYMLQNDSLFEWFKRFYV